MIAGKTDNEILIMPRSTRCHWYKRILPEEKEKAMKIVYINGLAKISKSSIKLWNDPEYRAKAELINVDKIRSKEFRTKISVSWTPERRAEQSRNMTGNNHFNWIDGRSYEPYPAEFSEKLKRQIRERDGYICQACGISQDELGKTLAIHHIDYNKHNNNPNNLITLCQSCNNKANHNREYWIEYFEEKMRNKNDLRVGALGKA